jgi:hypothetical protein
MVRLLVRPDGSFIEVVYANEHPDAVARTNVKLAASYPDAVPEDYSNDAYEAMKPVAGTLSSWRRRGDKIVVELQPDTPHPRQALLDEIRQASSIAALKAVLLKVVT